MPDGYHDSVDDDDDNVLSVATSVVAALNVADAVVITDAAAADVTHKYRLSFHYFARLDLGSNNR